MSGSEPRNLSLAALLVSQVKVQEVD